MLKTRDHITEERRRLKAEYGKLFDSVSALIFKADPIGIAFDNENPDEYDPEAGTIIPRLKDCKSEEDVLRVVHEEFSRWFDAENAGLLEDYRKIAKDLWSLWQAGRDHTTNPQA